MEYPIKCTNKDFYYKFLTVIKGAFDLSTKERMVLGEFIKIQEYARNNPQIKLDAFSSPMRKAVQKSMGISPHNLNNYIKSLKSKGAITGSGDSMNIPSSLIPQPDGNHYEVKFKFTIDE